MRKSAGRAKKKEGDQSMAEREENEMAVNTMINEQGQWGECFPSFNLGERLPVSQEQIKNSIKKSYGEGYGGAVSVHLKRGNIAEVTYKDGSKITIAYRTFRQTDRAKLPFYSMSRNKLEKLKEDKIEKVLLLFWEKQEKGGVAPFYYLETDLPDSNKWDFNREKELYRINAVRGDDGKYRLNGFEMTKAQTGQKMEVECGGTE